MTRRYCEVADTDVKKAHILASPVDNLDFTTKLTTKHFLHPKTIPPIQGDNKGNRPIKPNEQGYLY
jgi:hypothetical protein